MDNPEESHDSKNNRVVEYYKKYRQNPDLGKYFSGPEASLTGGSGMIGPHSSMLKENSEDKCKLLTLIEVDITTTHEIQEDVNNKNVSPSSSTTSVKKLEWDNGADIGYVNSYKLSTKKSASFPSLFTNNLSNKSNNSKEQCEEKPMSGNKEQLRNMYHQLTFSSGSSSSPPKENFITSSSPSPPKETTAPNSSSSQNEEILGNYGKYVSSSSSNGSNLIPYLKKRIGYPVAESTPIEDLKSLEPEGYRETPMLRGTSKPKRNIARKTESDELSEKDRSSEKSDSCSSKQNSKNPKISKEKIKAQREINLCLTKPVSIECIAKQNIDRSDKISQTSFSSERTTKSIQTETPRTKNKITFSDPNKLQSPLLQKIEFVEFEGDKTNLNKDSSRKNFDYDESKSLVTVSELKTPPLEKKYRKNKHSQKVEFVQHQDNPTDSSFSLEIKDGIYGSDSGEQNSAKTDKSLSSRPSPDVEVQCVTKTKVNIEELYKKELKGSEALQNMKTGTEHEPIKESDLTSRSTNKSTSLSSSSKGVDPKEDKKDSQPSFANSINSKRSNEMVLAEMISLKHSRDLNTDIKRSIDILQKLLKSKKYDQATKKYYIKKIVQKIVESKYSDDSTTSSEFFRPRKSNAATATDTIEMDKAANESKNVRSDSKLMDNVPWYPINSKQSTLRKRNTKNEDIRTQALPTGSSHELQSLQPTKDYHNLIGTSESTSIKDYHLKKERIQRNLGTCSESSDCFVYHSNREKKLPSTERNGIFPRRQNFSSADLLKMNINRGTYIDASAPKIDEKNWKNTKTLSEMLLENRDGKASRLGQGDYLLHVATNERQHQLSWINNEIEHLNKLKELLERKKGREKNPLSSLLKMNVEDMKVLSAPHLERTKSEKKSSNSTSLSQDLPSHEEAASLSSNSQLRPSPKDEPSPANRQNIQLYMCTTDNPMTQERNSTSEAKQCSCNLDTCKCCQTSTHEEKVVQCPASKQCTCQTEPKEDANIQCSCKVEAETTFKCGKADCQCETNSCDCKKSSSSSPSSSTGSSSTGSSDTLISCVCCKKKNILKDLMSKLPLCNPCQEIHQKCFYPYNYSNPLHSCLCYSLVDQGTLCQIKSTLTELERLDIYEQYCEILKNCKCCKECGCKCKLPKKFKNGCAYFLKLEDACPNKNCGQGDNRCDYNYEEYGEGDEVEEEDEQQNYLPEVTVKVPNCRGVCAQKKRRKNKNGTKEQYICPSIQTYLCALKPEFVENAERRRRILRDAALQREENGDNRKLRYVDQVNHLRQKYINQQINSDTNICGPYGARTKTYCVFDVELDDGPQRIKPRVFQNFKEMKDLTRRRYLHLSEVRSKKDIHKEKRLREANRILANTFTKRLQRSTLRGNVDIPPNVRVVSY